HKPAERPRVPKKRAEQSAKPKDRPRARKKLTARQHATLIAQLPAKQDGGTTPVPGKLSLLNAAAQVLAEAGEPMNCKQMVEQVTARKLWGPRQGGKSSALRGSSSPLGRRCRAAAGTWRSSPLGPG